MNAAIWFGGTVAMTFVARTSFFSVEVEKLFNSAASWKYYAGGVAQVVFEHFFTLQFTCAVVALLHFLGETFYLGRFLSRFRFGLLLGILALTVFSGFFAQPRMRQLHNTKYVGATEQLKLQAGDTFRNWHIAAQMTNLLLIGGVGVYFWGIIRQPDASRFSSLTKFHG